MDSVREAHDDVVIGWGGGLVNDVTTIIWMVVAVVWRGLLRFVGGDNRRKDRLTTFVNASIVGGRDNELRNDAVVVLI